MKPAYLFAAAALAMAPAVLPAAAPAEPVLAPGATRLDLTAEGSVERVSDVAQVTAGVVTQAATAQAAMAENATRMQATLAALRRAGVAPRDLQTASVDLSPQYRYGENQPPILTGYQATNQVVVRLRQIDRAGAVLDSLVAAGANRIDGPTLSVDAPEAALDEARGKAVAAARQRADLYAKAAGLRVVRILSISEAGEGGPVPPVPMAMMARSAKAEADTAIAAGEQKLAVRVSVSFELAGG